MRSLLAPGSSNIGYDDLVALYGFPPPPDSARPWVRAMFVSSTDGAAQGPDSRSGSLSSEADKQIFALQRSLCDVVLVGAGTARVEGYRQVKPSEVDTELRGRLGLEPVPVIAVVSRSLALDPELLGQEQPPTIVVTCEAAPTELLATTRERAHVIVAGAQEVDLAAALAVLAGLGHHRVVCEGGPTLLATVAAAACLDDLCLTMAPLLVGGERRRIMHGPELRPARGLTLAHLLEEDDNLFARYLVGSTA